MLASTLENIPAREDGLASNGVLLSSIESIAILFLGHVTCLWASLQDSLGLGVATIINYACTHSNRQTINYACIHSNRQTINYACTHSNRQTINYACTHSNRQRSFFATHLAHVMWCNRTSGCIATL